MMRLFSRFDDNLNESIEKYLAYAYYNKALIFAKEKDYKNELATYDALLEKFIVDISHHTEVVLVKAYLKQSCMY